jgi:predicted regulator of Ras-like GTPase activity (Roadblock/LC7/MglB family)
MTVKEDIARVALSAPALHQVFIVSMPDCLLVRSWTRAQRTGADDAAASLGNAFRAGVEAMRHAGSTAHPSMVTIEAEDTLALIASLSRETVACFIFDRTAPLGLVRVQARQLAEHIKQAMAQYHADDGGSYGMSVLKSAAHAQSPSQAAPIARETSDRPSPRGQSAIKPTSTQPDLLTPEMARAPTRSDFSLRQLQGQPPGTGDMRPPRPRGVRLLELFKKNAPDPHAALLRLSLRTGIPIEALESPDRLDDAQVQQIETSVREILGHDQVSI